MPTPAPQTADHILPRVLVVDDSAVIRQAIEKMLKADFEVVLAQDGETGWDRLFQDQQIQAVITDIEMPRLDGYAFICRIRAAEASHLQTLPIITITGAEDEETRLRAYACGANDFITKPLNSKQLQARLQAYVNPVGMHEAGDTEGRTDPQTGLYSRRGFLERVGEQMSKAAADGRCLALIRLDIDDPKRMYQQLGDDGVEPLLALLAATLREQAGERGLIARTGGAAFAVLTAFVSSEDALAWCERVRAEIETRPFKIGRHTTTITLSLGVATSAADASAGPDALLALAERRLLRAKSEGGNRVSTVAIGEDLDAEEVVLAAPEAAIADTRLTSEIELADLSVPELEGVAPLLESGKEHPLLLDLLSVDKALASLARGEPRSVAPYLAEFVEQILPLLDAYNEREGLELDGMLRALRERLGKRGSTG